MSVAEAGARFLAASDDERLTGFGGFPQTPKSGRCGILCLWLAATKVMAEVPGCTPVS